MPPTCLLLALLKSLNDDRVKWKTKEKTHKTDKFTLHGFRSMGRLGDGGDGVDDKPEELNPKRSPNAEDRHHIQWPLRNSSPSWNVMRSNFCHIYLNKFQIFFLFQSNIWSSKLSKHIANLHLWLPFELGWMFICYAHASLLLLKKLVQQFSNFWNNIHILGKLISQTHLPHFLQVLFPEWYTGRLLQVQWYCWE